MKKPAKLKYFAGNIVFTTLLISVTREDFNKFVIYSFAREKHNSIAWKNRGIAIWNN